MSARHDAALAVEAIRILRKSVAELQCATTADEFEALLEAIADMARMADRTATRAALELADNIYDDATTGSLEIIPVSRMPWSSRRILA